MAHSVARKLIPSRGLNLPVWLQVKRIVPQIALPYLTVRTVKSLRKDSIRESFPASSWHRRSMDVPNKGNILLTLDKEVQFMS